MSSERIDPLPYTRPPIMSLAGAITLCRVVAESCPASMPEPVKEAAGRLATIADAAQKAHAARLKAIAKTGGEDPRTVDKVTDRSWSALRGRLEMYTLLPVETYPDAGRAREILEGLFGELGLAFLKERYPEQYTIAESLLRRIDGEGMASDIERLAGSDFLQNVRLQHEAYGKVVTSMLSRERAVAEDLSEHLKAMGQALVDFAMNVLASVDRDDPESLVAARIALRPIDVFRRSTQARATKLDTDATSPEGSSIDT